MNDQSLLVFGVVMKTEALAIHSNPQIKAPIGTALISPRYGPIISILTPIFMVAII